jgi:hypothetical protein
VRSGGATLFFTVVTVMVVPMAPVGFTDHGSALQRHPNRAAEAQSSPAGTPGVNLFGALACHAIAKQHHCASAVDVGRQASHGLTQQPRSSERFVCGIVGVVVAIG